MPSKTEMRKFLTDKIYFIEKQMRNEDDLEKKEMLELFRRDFCGTLKLLKA